MDVIVFTGATSLADDCAIFAQYVCDELKSENHATETILVGANPPAHCTGCGKCRTSGTCVIDDAVNGWKARLEKADAFVLTGDIRNSGLSSVMYGFLERLSQMGKANPDFLRGKPGGFGLIGGRDGGMKAIFDMVSFFQHTSATLVWPCYWPFTWNDDTGKPFSECDAEGVAIARDLGKQMNWVLSR